MRTIKSIIVDDDAHTREELKDILGKYFPEIIIQAICVNGSEGLSAIESLKPEVVFLDIEMPDMSGFELLEQLREISFEVIFITSFNQYAIKAIRFSALDYLLKPVQVDELKTAMQRFMNKSAPGTDASARISNYLHNTKIRIPEEFKLALATTEGVYFLTLNDIIYCEGQINYTLFHLSSKNLSGKKKILSSKTLKEYDDLLADHEFIRVHKSYLVNRKHVTSITSDHKVQMQDGTLVEISKRKFAEVRLMLQSN